MPKTIRCAIYTRKSSEEGLEQEFNSLHAQREACEAYIKSQQAEGWVALPEPYDDGGLSGATMDRPALQALLEEVRAGRVDTIVVYKVDRLTRALSDFARIVELFDAHSVSFVSVTQQFNTTTSMGRLTLNVLLSFAQFEREVTGERIRDKIAASKKKGLWMGGIAPLGYRAEKRHLLIEPAEARTVTQLFNLYLERGTVSAVQSVARELGLRTRAGKRFSRNGLYLLLSNPIYAGRIRHRNTVYAGRHDAIIDETLFDTVQTRLAGQRIERKHRLDAKHPSLLAGLIYRHNGARLIPSHANKKGRRYRYYVEAPAQNSEPRTRPALRLAAYDIEDVVIRALDSMLSSLEGVTSIVGSPELTPSDLKHVEAARKRLQIKLRSTTSAYAKIPKIVQRIDVADNAVHIEVDRTALAVACGLDPNPAEQGPYRLSVPAALRRLGIEKRFLIGGDLTEPVSQPNPSLIKAILLARRWWRLWTHSEGKSLKQLAREEGVNDRYISQLLPLAFLAPDITRMILEGTQPPDLKPDRLIKHTKLPVDWAEQRKLLIGR
jgi:site-specific DNA recombinase